MVKNLHANAGEAREHGFNPWVCKIPWRRKQQSTPVFLPGKFHGQRNLVGCSPWGHKEQDMTGQLNTHTHTHTHTSYNTTYVCNSKIFRNSQVCANTTTVIEHVEHFHHLIPISNHPTLSPRQLLIKVINFDDSD